MFCFYCSLEQSSIQTFTLNDQREREKCCSSINILWKALRSNKYRTNDSICKCNLSQICYVLVRTQHCPYCIVHYKTSKQHILNGNNVAKLIKLVCVTYTYQHILRCWQHKTDCIGLDRNFQPLLWYRFCSLGHILTKKHWVISQLL